MKNIQADETSPNLTFSNESEKMKKELDIRTWISRKESVCPYAPGLARFIHLPEINSLSMSHVYYLAQELKYFYGAKENDKRVGRWMLLPHAEWDSHEEAHSYSERIFWLLNAAYYHLIRDKKSVQLALKQNLNGYHRGYKCEILNPIVGKLPNQNSNILPAKSLFCSALSPLYKSKKFYRYSPHCLMPLVYISEFEELRLKHPNVTKKINYEMAYGSLFEIFGDDLELDLDDFRQELPVWGAIIDRTAEIMRASCKGVLSQSPEVKGCPASNLSYFRLSPETLINKFYFKYADNLSILKKLVSQKNINPKQIISASFAGSGLYAIPDYPM
jgi:hypothetical protein